MIRQYQIQSLKASVSQLASGNVAMGIQHYHAILVFGLMLLVSACRYDPTVDQHSHYSEFPAGTVATLNRSLSFPAGVSRLYMQGGRLVSHAQLQIYSPLCYVQLTRSRQDSKPPYVVDPVEFSVERVWRENPLAAFMNPIAATHASSITLRTTIRIKANSHPDVNKIVCEIFTDPQIDNHLSVDDIREVSRGIITFR